MQVTTTEAVAPASQSAYQIAGQRFRTDSSGFAVAIAAAHAGQRRPRCLCLHGGIEMYVARLGDGFIVKRMPNTGNHHAPGCPSYEPPPEFSGLGQVLGSAITENPGTGETTLKLDFSMLKLSGRSAMPTAAAESDSVASTGTKLSLRGLLHYLWDQADLTRWQPGFAGKRTWSTVTKHLLQAAENKIARGDSLRSRLYIPEVFSVDQRDAINARRMAQWSQAIATPDKPQQLMLLIGEVKEIVPARYGFKTIVKHVPDQAFALDELLYRRLGRRFESALALWGATDDVHMVIIATFSVGAAGIPTIVELSLMPTMRHWLPVEDGFEKQLIERLVADGRAFVKGLRYNLSADEPLTTATLTDVGKSPVSLWIEHQRDTISRIEPRPADLEPPTTGARWVWSPSQGAVPTLPALVQQFPNDLQPIPPAAL